jgi:HPt (histidine-containing phosphotransfer) domain-containing protein
LLELSISECRPLAAAVQSAVARRESDAATQATHKFNGICSNVGADELATIGKDIERAVRSEDWPSAQSGCRQLDAGLIRFVDAATAVRCSIDKTAMQATE